MNQIGQTSVPATLSNLGPGFDVLGLALDVPRESVRAVLSSEPGIRIQGTGPFGDRIPTDPLKNVAAYAAARVLEAYDRGPYGLELMIEKTIPPGSGLGSSAASGVGGAVAAARALGVELDPDRLLAIARDAETLAAGSAHLDNVAPALFGGFVAVVSTDPPRVRRMRFPAAWRLAVILPEIEVRTADARAVLPASIPREDAIANLRNLAGLLDAIACEDLAAFASHLVDRIAVPYRQHLWPYLPVARAAALSAGAPALEVSGSGPAIFAPCPDDRVARSVVDAVVAALAEKDLAARGHVARAATRGALTP